MNQILHETFRAMAGDYKDVFRSYYPSHESTGFTERNLTHSFVGNIVRILNRPNPSPRAFAWMEAPFGKDGRKDFHLDAVVFSPRDAAVLFVESKRLSTSGKKTAIVRDIGRMRDQRHRRFILEKYKHRGAIQNQYLVCLADVWIETKWKKAAPNWWTGDLSTQGSFVQTVYEATRLDWEKANNLFYRFNDDDCQSYSEPCLQNYCVFLGFHRITNELPDLA